MTTEPVPLTPHWGHSSYWGHFSERETLRETNYDSHEELSLINGTFSQPRRSQWRLTLKGWFPYNRPDRPDRSNRLKMFETIETIRTISGFHIIAPIVHRSEIARSSPGSDPPTTFFGRDSKWRTKFCCINIKFFSNFFPAVEADELILVISAKLIVKTLVYLHFFHEKWRVKLVVCCRHLAE